MLDDGWPWKTKHDFWKLRVGRFAPRTRTPPPFPPPRTAPPLRRRLPPLPPLRSAPPPSAMSCGRPRPAGGLFISSPISGCGSCFSFPLPLLFVPLLSLLWFLFFRSVIPFPILFSFSLTGALLFVFARVHLTCDFRASDSYSKRKAKP
jgi:hypothetical protein